MTLKQWANRHGVPLSALNELRAILTSENTDPEPLQGISEAAVQAAVRLEATHAGARLWRNNVGAYKSEGGGLVRYGLCNDTAAMNKRIKSSDLIGIKPVLIQPHHVGQVIGQFVAREVKRVGWTYKGTEREQAQLKFIELVTGMGGDACFVAGVGSFSDTRY
jgi:hypothetical protein